MRKILAFLLITAIAIGTIGCGGKEPGGEQSGKKRTAKVTPSPTSVSTPSPTPTATPTPTPQIQKHDPIDAAKLYSATAVENLYEIEITGADNYSLSSCQMCDNYLLLRGFDFVGTDGYQNAVFLLNLENPEEVYKKYEGNYYGEYFLLREGKVLEVFNGEWFRIYDKTFSLLDEWNYPCGNYLGTGEDGTIWFFKDECLQGYTENGFEYVFYVEGAESGWYYLGEAEGELYFHLFDEFYSSLFVKLNQKTHLVQTIEDIPRSPTVNRLLMTYEHPERWYVAGIDAPNDITCFGKMQSNEALMGSDENILISTQFNYEEETGIMYTITRVYDLETGAICHSICSDCISSVMLLSPSTYDNGYILFTAEEQNKNTDQHQKLYLYDVRHIEADEKEPDYYQFSASESDYDNPIVEEIEEKYPFKIYTAEFGLSEFTSGYSLVPCEDTEELDRFLEELLWCLSKYPDGFFEEVLGNEKKGIHIFLCGEFVVTSPESLPNPAACVNSSGKYINMVFDTEYLDWIQSNLLHETTHMMEVRLNEYATEHDLSFGNYWESVLNTSEYSYFNSYVDLPDGEEYFAGTADGGCPDAWFIDAYAKSDCLEDRARIMEYIFQDGYAFYYEDYPHIMRKAQFMCAFIREAFPSVKSLSEPVFWEARTGIVDLYEEFPDCVNGADY